MQQLHPGDRVDHYQIESLVAMSGMASIFRANDLRTGRRVALKVPLPEEQSDPISIDRFKRKVEIGKKLHHPALVRVLDDHRRNRLYMVKEWAEGCLLRDFLGQQGKLPIDRAVRIAIEICGALDYMHNQDVVHRDLSPENITVDSSDQVKIIDLRLASKVESRRLTFAKVSQIMGSPNYISPEQVRGKRGDARSDVYAVGVIPYEMLTGRVPFTGSNAFVLMNARLSNDPMPPRNVNSAISPQLQAIVCRALARDPLDRYASASEWPGISRIGIRSLWDR